MRQAEPMMASGADSPPAGDGDASTRGGTAVQSQADGSSSRDDHTNVLRVIKRYTNRKLYDTLESRYVTLGQVAQIVREGYDVRVIDSSTSDDMTQVTLALIIFEEERLHTHSIPLQTLREVILRRGGSLFAQLRRSALENLLPGRSPNADANPEQAVVDASRIELASSKEDARGDAVEAARDSKSDAQLWLEDRARAALATFRPFLLLQRKIVQLSRRIELVESRLHAAEEGGEPGVLASS